MLMTASYEHNGGFIGTASGTSAILEEAREALTGGRLNALVDLPVPQSSVHAGASLPP